MAATNNHVVLAAIDVGTNSVKLELARPLPNGSFETLHEERDPVRPGEGVFKTPGSLELAFVKDMCRIDRTTVRNTFELWLNWVGAAYELASEAVRNNKFVENGMSKSEVLEILWLYKKLSSAAKPSALLDQQMDEIERVFNIKS